MKMNIFAINLKKYSTKEEFEKLGSDNGLSLDGKKLVEYRNRFTKIFVNRVDMSVVAAQLGDGSIRLTSEGISTLSKVDNLQMGILEDDFTIDGILDKISESGVNSLTAKEKIFLKKNSK